MPNDGSPRSALPAAARLAATAGGASREARPLGSAASPRPLDAALLVCTALFFGALGAAAPLATLAVTVGAAVLLFGRVSRRALLLSCCVVAVGTWRAQAAVARADAERAAVRDALGAPSRCAGVGAVLRSPVVRGGATVAAVRFEALECEGKPLPVPLVARLYGGPAALGRGDRVEVVAQLAPTELFRNADLPDPRFGAARDAVTLSGPALAVEVVERGHGLGASIDALRAHARERILATFATGAAPMARALVLGENDLDESDDEAFRRSGLAHVLAVSGTHLVFAVVALVRALGFVLVRIERLAARGDVGRLSAAGGAVLALLYADFAGGSGSAWRAAWMLAASFSVRALGRRPHLARSIAASLATGAAVDPLAAFDLSFLLSIAATTGLIVLGQACSRSAARLRSRALRYLATGSAATMSSMALCAPVLALLSPELTIAGIAANLVAGPLGEVVALPLCLAHVVVAWCPPLERGVALVASGALLFVKSVAHLSAAARWLAVDVPLPTCWHFAVLTVAGLGAVCQARPQRAAGGTDSESGTAAGDAGPETGRDRALGAANRDGMRGWAIALWLVCGAVGLWWVERAAIAAGQPRGVLRVTAIDVGQGDATLIDLPDGRAMLVDGGGFVGSPVDPGRRVLLPLLRARRRDHLDIVALTHPHPDHFGGLVSVVEQIPVGELWDTGQGRAEGAGPTYARLMASARARGARVVSPTQLCGAPRRFGGATLRVLGPCPDFEPGVPANDNSLVMHLSLGRRAALLVGDAEGHQEAALLAAQRRHLRADLLKVGHHGSRTSSSPGFLSAVAPKLATISCGVRNRYGHPHGVTLRKLLAQGIVPLRLDRVGAVRWWTDGEQVEARVTGADVPTPPGAAWLRGALDARSLAR